MDYLWVLIGYLLSYIKHSDIATETLSGVTSLTQSHSVTSQPFSNDFFFSAPADCRNSWSFFVDWSSKAEADELKQQCSFWCLQAKKMLSPLKPEWPHTSPFWPLDSLSVTFGLCQQLDGQPTEVHSPVNKGLLCKREELRAEIRSEEKVLNSSSVFQQCVQDCCHYKKWNFTRKHFLCPWFKHIPSLRKQLSFR